MGIKDINKTIKTILSDNIDVIRQNANIYYNNLVNRYNQTNTLEIYNELVEFNKIYESLMSNNFCYFTINIDYFTGKSIAIDTNILIHSRMNIVYNQLIGNSFSIEYNKDELILKTKKMIMSFIYTLLSKGITPVFIFDGKTNPLKDECVNDRIEGKKFRQDNATMLINEHNNLNLLEQARNKDSIMSSLKHLVNVTSKDIDDIYNMLLITGIPTLKAEYDGEILCSALNQQNLVSAVYGNDTDNYPLGTELLLTSLEKNTFNVVSLKHIKWLLSMFFQRIITHNELIDLCILHGCDFNNYQRMYITQKKDKSKTKSVGPKTSLELIKQYGNFENFPIEYSVFNQGLKINECRSIFTYKNSGYNYNDVCIDLNSFNNISTLLNELGFEPYFINNFMKINKKQLKLKI
jgi:flap endonuclease-1